MEPLPLLAVAIVAAVGGVVLGVLLRSVWASQTMQAATAEARARQKDIILEAKDEKLRMQREAEEEARARRAELSGLESRLLQRDEQLLERERELDRTREDLAKAHAEQVEALERVAGLSADDAKDLLIQAVREEA